jgi:hypothetical protein
MIQQKINGFIQHGIRQLKKHIAQGWYRQLSRHNNDKKANQSLF